MGIHELHDKTIEKTYTWRTKWFGPLVNLLVRMGITANMITNFRILFVFPLAYFLYFRMNLWAAFWTYLLFWLVDTIDGSVARATNTASDKGKFYDVFIDNLVYSFMIIFLIFAGVAPAALLAYHVLIQLSAYILGVVANNEGKPSDWIIKPQAEEQYNKIIIHAIIFLFLLGVDVIKIGFVIMNTWLTLQSIYLYRKLQQQKHPAVHSS